jgi:diamine N-acetyltransferase
VKVRVATAADAATLAALALKTFLDAFAAGNRAEDIKAYTDVAYGEPQQRRELEDASIVTLLVTIDGEREGVATGYAQLRRTPNGPHGDVELARFYVDQAHHGRGVAQALMSAVESHTHALGGTRLWLGVWERNHRAIAFYRKCGFEKVSTQPFLLGSDLQTDWVMSRGM